MTAIRVLIYFGVLVGSHVALHAQQMDQFGNYCEGHWQGGYCICPNGSLANGRMVGNTVQSVCSGSEEGE